MASLEFERTGFEGLLVVRRKPIGDARGHFERMYCADEFEEAGLERGLVQINRSVTQAQGAIRGMHFQRPPYAEDKYITCLRGKVFDVAVDIRRSSPTFLQWRSFILDASEDLGVLIPRGFAHGFQTMTPNCQLLYMHTAAYTASSEGGLNPLDPRLAISWPLEPTEMSERDRSHAPVETFEGISADAL